MEKGSTRRRRRLRQELDPGSPSPVMGMGAMTSVVLLYSWCIFMIHVFVTHYPEGLETETLRRYEEMFAWWMLAALMTVLFLVVEMAARAVAFPGRNLRRLAVDLFAVILVTMVMVSNLQFSILYSMHYWNRLYPDSGSTYSVRGEFSYPSSIVPGSTANEEWREFQEWLDFRGYYAASLARLDFQPDQPVQNLAQCTPEIWSSQCEEIRFQVGDGPEHRLRSPLPWTSLSEVLLPAEDGNLDALELLEDVMPERFRDQIAPEEDVRRDYGASPLGPGELDRLIQDSNRRNPLKVLVPRDASMEWLDSLLRRLEDRGAEHFMLMFHG